MSKRTYPPRSKNPPGFYRMTPGTLQYTVYQAVLELGECSVSQVVARTGHLVSAAVAHAAARRERRSSLKRGRCRPHSLAKPLDRGVRIKVGSALLNLLRAGRIRRLRHGVYAPPLPRLHLLDVG